MIREKLKQYYMSNDGYWKDKNISENDDVIVDNVRYFSFRNAMKTLNMSYAQLRNVLVRPGNGFVDPLK